MFRVLTSATKYFLIVFAIGFLLGVLRTLFVVPHVGERWAELMEMPLMFMAMLAVARWLFRSPIRASNKNALAIGGIALAMMLAAESLLVIQMRGMTFTEYFGNRDPVSGIAYVLMLVIFGLLPWAVTTRTRQATKPSNDSGTKAPNQTRDANVGS